MFSIGPGIAVWFVFLAVMMGAAAGLLIGALVKRVFGGAPSRIVHALLGTASFMAVFIVGGWANTKAAYFNGRVEGWRGLILNNELLLAVLLTLAVITVRHLSVRRATTLRARAGEVSGKADGDKLLRD